MKAINDVYNKYHDLLLSLDFVSDLALGEVNGKEVIIVFLSNKAAQMDEDEIRKEIPGNIEGFDIIVKNEIKIG